MRMKIVLYICASLALRLAASAQAPAQKQRLGTEFGISVFEQQCTKCHGNPAVDRAPSPAAIRQMPPERIYEALTTGVMKTEAANLTDEQKRRLAEYMGGRPLGSAALGDAKQMPNQCPAEASFPDPANSAEWSGWGDNVHNTRFQDAKQAGLTPAQIPNLKLKWAFGFPLGVSAFGQPSVASGHVFVGSDIGYVYSLDMHSGCVHWSYKTKAAVRTAITIGRNKAAPSHYAIYFGDMQANVYALDALSGALLWTKRAEEHFSARITAAPTLYEGRLYVPISTSEGFSASTLDYPCCTFRGSVVALNANTGDQIWKAYSIPEPKPTRKNSAGTQLYAPSGVAVWNSPTVDAKRHAIYFGTGDSATEPAPDHGFDHRGRHQHRQTALVVPSRTERRDSRRLFRQENRKLPGKSRPGLGFRRVARVENAPQRPRSSAGSEQERHHLRARSRSQRHAGLENGRFGQKGDSQHQRHLGWFRRSAEHVRRPYYRVHCRGSISHRRKGLDHSLSARRQSHFLCRRQHRDSRRRLHWRDGRESSCPRNHRRPRPLDLRYCSRLHHRQPSSGARGIHRLHWPNHRGRHGFRRFRV